MPYNAMFLMKPAGNACNMSCDYCYIRNRKPAPPEDIDLQSAFQWMVSAARKRAQDRRLRILVTWHGGEPFLRGHGFYESAFNLQREIERQELGLVGFDNQIQTNGYHVHRGLLSLLKRHDVGVSVSFDGTPDLHDLHRRSLDGGPTSEQVLQTIHALRRHQIRHGVLGVLTPESLQRASDIYVFMKGLGVKSYSFNAAMDLQSHRPLVEPDEFGRFLVKFFHLWISDPGSLRLNFFENVIRSLVGRTSRLCKFNADLCGNIHAVMANGDVFLCDDYGTGTEYRLGNIHSDEDIDSVRRRLRGTIKEARRACESCVWYAICGAGCPRSWNQYRRDVFCVAYQRLFAEVRDWIRSLGQETVC